MVFVPLLLTVKVVWKLHLGEDLHEPVDHDEGALEGGGRRHELAQVGHRRGKRELAAGHAVLARIPDELGLVRHHLREVGPRNTRIRLLWREREASFLLLQKRIRNKKSLK